MTAVTSALMIAANRHRLSLEKSLRLYRTEQAFIRTVPAVSIFGNKLLHDIAASKPTTVKQLMGLRGMGVRRCKWYGSDIIRLVGLTGKPGQGASPSLKGKPPSGSLGKAAKVAKPRRKSKAKLICKRSNPTAVPPPRPRPRPKPKPRPRPAKVLPNTTPATKLASHRKTSVYILELQDGRVYVGSSTDVGRRVAQHTAGQGSAYTRVYKPTGVLLPRLGNVSGDGDAAERDETLRYMYQRGIPFVRGWKFTQVVMPPDDFDEAEANIRELFDLCRKCGFKGHFLSQCNATFDRWGKECGV